MSCGKVKIRTEHRIAHSYNLMVQNSARPQNEKPWNLSPTIKIIILVKTPQCHSLTANIFEIGFPVKFKSHGGAVVSWLVHLTLERAIWVRALAGDIVLCSLTRHSTLTVPLSTQAYKQVPTNLMLGGSPATDQHPIQGGVEILLVTSCY